MKYALTTVLTGTLLTAFCPTEASAENSPIRMVIMDPMAAPLACDCVQGYAQRKYEKLGAYLQKQLNRPVQVVWSESLKSAVSEHGPAHIVIGKHSVVKHDAARLKSEMRPILSLTDINGETTQKGLIVVRKADSAMKVKDLDGYRIFFGPKECDEKNAAPIALLKGSGVPIPSPLEVSPACSTAASSLLDLPASENAAAVISSYAEPLLEGCGTIKKGDLRVIGRSNPVPFITAFVSEDLEDSLASGIETALLDVELNAELLIALETGNGFVRWKPSAFESDVKKKVERSASDDPGPPGAQEITNSDWPGWRGERRDGRVDWLPDELPDPLQVEWTANLTGDGVGGLAVAEGCVVIGSRDTIDRNDVFQCFDAKSGDLLWQHFYPAIGSLDYGNSPRATPLIRDGLVFTLGAFGDLHCIELQSGLPLWRRNIAREFKAEELTWGHSGSPLIAGGNLIVQPGGQDASLVALEPETGELVWKTPGIAAGYSSFVTGRFGGVEQVIGYDAVSLGGWSVKDGQRLWKLIPPEKGDFNVPTVIPFNGDILVSTENNGTRRYGFASNGSIRSDPIAANPDLTPDSHTPVLSGGLIFGIWNEFYGVDSESLKTVSNNDDDAFAVYGSLIASTNRLICLTADGELLLISTDTDTPEILSRHHLVSRGTDVLSHPAIAGRALFVRTGKQLQKIVLSN